jgi:hypothetical protein
MYVKGIYLLWDHTSYMYWYFFGTGTDCYFYYKQ